jgi:tetraacyldisaccharide 4'-kinase
LSGAKAMREPAFWWRERGAAARVLSPLAAAYGCFTAHRLKKSGSRIPVPVVCIGDPTVGGAGKTPTALAVARLLDQAGERPVFLTRGYGGREAGPVQVDPVVHRAEDVGDEPLLLAGAAPTVVAKARVGGAAAAVRAGASVIVMDDGFQNPALAKDFAVLVVDSGRGVGNGMVTPAGPLRAPLGVQLDRANALLIVGPPAGAEDVAQQARARQIPVFRGQLRPDTASVAALRGNRLLAFAGIGSPEKFFGTLMNAGLTVTATRAFADHHHYTQAEATSLCEQAEREGLLLVTTEKDRARLQGDRDAALLAMRSRVLPVTLTLQDELGFRSLLMKKLAAARAVR